MKRRIAAVALFLMMVNGALLLAQKSQPATPAIRVLISNGVKGVVENLRGECEQAVGHPISMEFSTAASLNDRIKSGEAFDVAILTSETIDGLIAAGKISAATRADIGQTGIGVGFHMGAPKPDVSSPQALKQTLLKAKTIALNKNGASASYVMKAFDKLGIQQDVKSKLVYEQESGRPQIDVAEGKAELVLTLIPEIAVYKGVGFAGPLPAELQSYIGFAAGVSAGSHQSQAAKALIDYLKSSKMTPAFKAGGVDRR